MGTLFVITFELFGVSNMERIEAYRTIGFRYCRLSNGTAEKGKKKLHIYGING